MWLEHSVKAIKQKEADETSLFQLYIKRYITNTII